MKKFLKTTKYTFSILGCVLGAGFISGTEIYSFFVKFGIFGLFGIIVSGLLFAIITYKTTTKNIINSQKYSDFSGKNDINCNKTRQKTNKIIKNHSKNAKNGLNNTKSAIKNDKLHKNLPILPICQYFVTGAMVAGIVQVLSLMGGNQFVWTSIICVLLSFLLFFGIRVASSANILVVAAALVFVPLVFIFGRNNFFYHAQILVDYRSAIISVIFACFYMAMNSVASMPILQSLKVKTRRQAVAVSVATGLALTLLLGVFYFIVLWSGAGANMPVLSVISSGPLKILYSALFVFAMFSTMLSSGIGAKSLLAAKMDNIFASIVCSLAVCIISFVGFANLVSYVYPIIGLAMIIYAIVQTWPQPQGKKR